MLSVRMPSIISSFLLTLTLLAGSFATAQSTSDYPFPAKDPYLATIFAAFSNPKMPVNFWEVEYKPSRQGNPIFPDHNSIDLALFQTSKPAPLVLMIAGVGGTGASGTSQALGEIFLKHGIQTLALPNPISWGYTLGFSDEGAPGYLPRDSEQYYKWIQTLLAKAKKEQGLRYTSVSVFGYSNGGLLAAFLANKDSQQSKPLFSKVILLNPAVDIEFGVNTLDSLYTNGNKIPKARRTHLLASIYNEAADVAAAANPVEALFAMLKKYAVTSADIQWLIGNVYHGDMGDVIFASQIVKDRGFLKTPYSQFRINDRWKEVKKFLFKDYINLVVLPSLPEKDRANVYFNSSIYSQLEALKKDKRVFLFENADDFILKPGDTDLLKETFGDRMFLFPLGGHMGNVLFPINVQMYLNVLK